MTASLRARSIRLIGLDVDGVMTDGGITMNAQGVESKTFNVQDGLGIKLAQKSGIQFAIVTGRTSGVVEARARDLGITQVFQGVADKGVAMRLLCQQLQISPEAAAFMGDDLIDLPAMRMVQLAIAPANANHFVKNYAHLVTQAAGGEGAIREAIEFILIAQNNWQPLLDRYLEPQ